MSFRRTIPVLFFLSGGCALVYEVVWIRMLTPVFGAPAFATSTNVASFFTGLTLGNFYFGRVVDRSERNPLITYALLEGGDHGVRLPHAAPVRRGAGDLRGDRAGVGRGVLLHHGHRVRPFRPGPAGAGDAHGRAAAG